MTPRRSRMPSINQTFFKEMLLSGRKFSFCNCDRLTDCQDAAGRVGWVVTNRLMHNSDMYCIVTVVLFVIIFIKFYVCMYGLSMPLWRRLRQLDPLQDVTDLQLK